MNSKEKPNECEPRKHHLIQKKSVLSVTTSKNMDRNYITLEKEKKRGNKEEIRLFFKVVYSELANCNLKKQYSTSILKIITSLIWNCITAVPFDLLQLHPRPRIRIRSVPGNKTPPLIISPMMHPTDQMSTENKMQ